MRTVLQGERGVQVTTETEYSKTIGSLDLDNEEEESLDGELLSTW